MLINNSPYGFTAHPDSEEAQSFKPTKNSLTAVALYLNKYGNPHKQTTITIAINKNEPYSRPLVSQHAAQAMD